MSTLFKADGMKRNFHPPRNVRWSLLSLFGLFKTIGLATFSVRSLAPKKKRPNSMICFTASKLGVCYNLLLCSCILGSTYVTLPYIYTKDYLNRTVVTTTIELLQAVLGVLVITSILLYYCVNQSSLVRIGNYLVKLEEGFRRARYPRKKGRIFRVFLVVYSFKLFLLTSVLYTDVVAFQTSLVSWLTDIWPATFVGWLFIQYFSVVSLIDANFENVNYAIQNLRRSWSDDARVECLYQARRIFVSSSQIQFLVQLRDTHGHLCNISTEISRFYSLPTISGLSFIFFALIYNAYYLIEPMVVTNTVLDTPALANTVIWIVLLLYPFGLLTAKITEVLDEIGKTGGFVHELINSVIDGETKSEVKQCRERSTFSLLNDHETIFASVAPSESQIHRQRVLLCDQYVVPIGDRCHFHVSRHPYRLPNGKCSDACVSLQFHGTLIRVHSYMLRIFGRRESSITGSLRMRAQ